MYKKVFISIIVILALLIFTGCQGTPTSQLNKDFPKFLPISEKDISEIKLWGTENGYWHDGRVLSKEESTSIIEWVNSAKSLGTIELPPEMAAPYAEIIIYMLDKKEIYIFLWHDDIIINYADSENFKMEQQDLKNYLSQRNPYNQHS